MSGSSGTRGSPGSSLPKGSTDCGLPCGPELVLGFATGVTGFTVGVYVDVAVVPLTSATW